jgi:polyphenol oxidase
MLILKTNLLTLPHVAHGFFGRNGGASKGIYASLNCAPASQDEREALHENRLRVAASFGKSCALVTLQQYHSTEVVTVRAPWTMEGSPKGDALVTDKPGIILGLNTADCAPVLFADPEANVIGAAHAGWKGALGGICEATIAAMEKIGAMRTRIRAAVGPCIGKASYEVGADFREQFPDDAAPFFAAAERTGAFYFDLESYVVARLETAGIANIEALHADTFVREDEFFSFRRATIRGEADYGREISAIMLTD